MIESIVAVALVLGGLIFFHELGHFLAARAFGMGVSTFSLGFGPKILGFTRGKTRYILSAIPLGGYVQLVAQDPDDQAPDDFPPRDRLALLRQESAIAAGALQAQLERNAIDVGQQQRRVAISVTAKVHRRILVQRC